MVSLPLKACTIADLKEGLRAFVEKAYSKEQAAQHKEAFASAHALRERMRSVYHHEKGAKEVKSPTPFGSYPFPPQPTGLPDFRVQQIAR
eukprot:6181378-Pleurochrysis_carterae.AAC.2